MISVGSMNQEREIVQLAIGPSACAVVAHGLNLQGLAIGETCFPVVTHGEYQHTFVPRAILVDHHTAASESDEEQDVVRLASSLAFHPNSRYRVPSKQNKSESSFASTGRHVNWDDEEEDDEHDEEDETIKQEQQALAFHRQLQSAQEPMEKYWKAKLESKQPTPPSAERILMPPYRPDTLFTHHRSNFGDTVQTYTIGQSEDYGNLWETVRQRLEECDSCQGVLLSHSNGVDAGLATSLLREWKDECPNKSSLVFACGEETVDDSDATVQSNSFGKTRTTMEGLLALCDHSDLADAVVPINASSSADVACALEAITLPFRLRPSKQAVTLLTSAALYQDDFTGCLSFREFLRTLQRQSASRNILNLSSCRKDPESLGEFLLSGTSVQRDLRMRQPGYASGIHRGRDELPGRWLSETIVEGGLMSSWLPEAPSQGAIGDRSFHHNFALSAAYRPTKRITISDYSTCLQESLGIRYRPEQTMVTVVNESLADLTGSGYGAGSYWVGRANRPILATLDNSSRVYPFLHRACRVTERVVAPQSRKSLDRSRYNQDVALGLLPELDDMKDALTTLFDLRDSYSPPDSSGLVFDDADDDF